eukprot:gene7353-7195_t
MTVWQNLFMKGGAKSGQTVLIHGGSSGIGTAAIQLCKKHGLRTFVTVGNQEKADFCLGLGAEKAYLYKTQDWEQLVLQDTQQQGVDLILDMVAGEYLNKDLSCVRPQGMVIVIALLASGAYTGEVSVDMLKEFGVKQVLVGHSERRQYHAESSVTVAEKAVAAIQGGITPIVCVGETLAEREAGKVEAVIASQLDPVIERCSKFVENGIWNLVIAYEPVWAIGTGVTASPEQAQEVHAMIRARLNAMLGPE